MILLDQKLNVDFENLIRNIIKQTFFWKVLKLHFWATFCNFGQELHQCQALLCLETTQTSSSYILAIHPSIVCCLLMRTCHKDIHATQKLPKSPLRGILVVSEDMSKIRAPVYEVLQTVRWKNYSAISCLNFIDGEWE